MLLLRTVLYSCPFSSPSLAPGPSGPRFCFQIHQLLQIFFVHSICYCAISLSLLALRERRICVVAMASLSTASSFASSATLFAAPGAASSAAAAAVPFSASSVVRMATVNRRLPVVARATPQNKEDVKDKIPNAIAEAQKTCEDDPTSAPCAVAWDEVEELTAEASHQRDRKKTTNDPLETYCADNPETDECRTYED